MTVDRVSHVVVSADRFQGLDGLRGFALLTVIVAHLNLLSCGWAGMSSFFVLSGFLITRILFLDYDQSETIGSYFRRFYVRRVLRVFPVYYSYLLALTACAYLIEELAPIRDELAPAYLYYYNFHIAFPHYHTRALGHLWSMSVEEQFYFVWPCVVWLTPRRVFPYLCLALVGIGPVLREWMFTVYFPRHGFEGPQLHVSTFTYLDAFAAGALVNFLQWRPTLRVLGAYLAAMLVAGFAANGWYAMDTLSLGWPLFLPNGHQYAWGYTAVDLMWVLIICAILGEGPVKRFFSWRVFEILGRQSYPTYIWHFPLLSLTSPLWQISMDHLGRVLGTVAFGLPYCLIVFALAAGVHRYIEVPANRLKDRFRPPKVAAVGN